MIFSFFISDLLLLLFPQTKHTTPQMEWTARAAPRLIAPGSRGIGEEEEGIKDDHPFLFFKVYMRSKSREYVWLEDKSCSWVPIASTVPLPPMTRILDT